MGSTALTLVNQVNPTGGHVYTTEAADTQGLLVLHQVTTGAGTLPGQPGQVTVADGVPMDSGASAAFFVGQARAASVGESAPSVALGLEPNTAVNAVTNPNSLPLGLVEQVFADLERAALIMQDGMLGQPGAVFDTEPGDSTPTEMRDLAISSQAGGVGQRDWAPDACMASLAQAARRGLATSAADLLGGDVSVLDEADLAGLEAFFAREAR